MSNTLIIGLGGTGGKVIREFRKRYFEEFKTLDPRDNTYIDYLYVDSDEGDLKTPWRVQGTSIALTNSQKVSTHGLNVSDLDQLQDRPSLNSFISTKDVDLIKEKLGKIISEGIGGQRRRLGRMLMAGHNNLGEGFKNKLTGRVKSLQNESNQNDVHFHIVAGLAGGTGSGSIVDAVAQIRKIYGDSPQIHLYIYVPEQQTVYSDNVDYYKANGYAALQELNAISAGLYKPLDISGDKDIYTNEPARIESSLPINGTYLFTNINEKGRILDLKEELPQMVGDFLFQKIYVDKDATQNEKLRRIEKFENGDPIEEVDATGMRARSVRFLSFGFRRVIFPEQEIKEYIAYKFAERATLQMHYQTWTSQGFSVVSRENATDDITLSTIQKDREQLFLGNKILMRETSLPGNEPVHEFFEEFKGPATNYSEEALSMDKEEWLNFFDGNLGAYFKKKFRRMGVVAYFAQETTESMKYARKIVAKIEDFLFQKWETGTYGALQLEEYIKVLMKDCDKRIDEFSKSVPVLDGKIADMRDTLNDMREDVTKTGIFANLVGKRQDRFLEYCEKAQEYYVTRTRLEATKYAITLLESIKSALQELEANIFKFSALLSVIADKAEIQANVRCKEENENDAKTLRKYDKNAVDEIQEKAIHSEEKQAQIARNVRTALVDKIGETANKGFYQFLKAYHALEDNIDISADEALNVIFDVCLRSADKEVEDRSIDDNRFKVTNVNILEKLKHEYDDTSGEKLRAFAHELMESAQTFVQFNNSEVSLEANGNINRKMTAVIIYLPEEKDDSGFRDRLAKAFIDAKGDPEKVTITKSHRQDQIAIMTVSSMFPLRHIENLKSLKESYDRLMARPDKELHKFVLHTETFAEPLPSLYEASAAEIAVELPKPVMLGFAMGIIREGVDSTTGRKALYIFTKDKYGDTERSEKPIGKDFLDVIANLKTNRKDFAILKDEVKKRLKEDFVHIEKRKELMNEVNSVLRTHILQACGGDEFGGEYSQYKKVRNDIGDNELKID